MICAIGLLYLDEETTFWWVHPVTVECNSGVDCLCVDFLSFRFMVMVIEKLMPQNYYSMGLAAAQADQVSLHPLHLPPLSPPCTLSLCLFPPSSLLHCLCAFLSSHPFSLTITHSLLSLSLHLLGYIIYHNLHLHRL